MVAELMAIANALGADISHVSGARAATISPQHQRIADSLKRARKPGWYWVIVRLVTAIFGAAGVGSGDSDE